eukprot:TRINITY_DN1649_c1_g3_i2.p1 TRINITY_DN1649_c1_g3~~TRINITY_DN1649_c1_g3_i2.p1  ORF type:complete len:946 (+),score=191.78 TRINITY_DN1649_c1_g3_i2:116-2953(+)
MKRVPYGYWTNPVNQKKFLDQIAKELKVSTTSDWKKISKRDIIERGGSGLLTQYGDSLNDAISEIYGVSEEEQRLLQRSSWYGNHGSSYWKGNVTRQRHFLEDIGEELRLTRKEDFFKASGRVISSINRRGGNLLLELYDFSFEKLINAAFPESLTQPKNLESWKQLTMHFSDGHWEKRSHRRQFLEGLERLLGLSAKSEWKNVTSEMIEIHGGRELLALYDNSLPDMLMDVFPEYPHWNSIRFNETKHPRGYWTDKTNQRRFLDSIKRELNIDTAADWAKLVDTTVIYNRGGKLVLSEYGGSVYQMLRCVYPEVQFQADDFANADITPLGKWHDPNERRKFLNLIRDEFQIRGKQDWSKVTIAHIKSRGGSGLLQHYGGSLFAVLQETFPELGWESSRAKEFGEMSKGQKLVYEFLKKHISDLEVNYRHPNLIHKLSGANMELDLFSPSLKLAIEYQGLQHYDQTRGQTAIVLSKQQQRDTEKKDAANAKGITLVEIPYWWNETEEQLLATIKDKRPDLFTGISISAAPVPATKPAYIDKLFMQPTEWKNEIDPTGWWMYPVEAGIRVQWNPWTKKFMTSLTKGMTAPAGLAAIMPRITLDGVLLNKRFAAATDLDDPLSSFWDDVVFEAFDAPDHNGTYEQRIKYLKTFLTTQKDNKRVYLQNSIECGGRDDMMVALEAAVRTGAAGLILRKPGSYYENRTSSSLKIAKLKFTDEAVVIGVETNQSYLLLESSIGTLFNLSTQYENEKQPSLVTGTVLSYQFFGFDDNKTPLVPIISEVFPPSVKWSEYSPYRLSYGQNRGSPKVCRGCKKKLRNDELRVVVKGLYTPTYNPNGQNEEMIEDPRSAVTAAKHHDPKLVKFFAQEKLDKTTTSRHTLLQSYHFCLSPQCLKRGYESDSALPNIFYPPFEKLSMSSGMNKLLTSANADALDQMKLALNGSVLDIK